MHIKDFENKIREIPTLPTVADEINRAARQDKFTAKSLGKIIQKDPSLTSKILQLSNSSFYGFAKKITTMDRAVSLLGFHTVSNLALSIAVSKFFSSKVTAVDMLGLWRHSLGCAVAAKSLMSQIDEQLAEEAFICGLLHDIGAIIIIRNFPNQMLEALRLMREKSIPQSEAEKEVIGVTHQEVGAFLADKWNFPEKYSRIIRLHHSAPSQSLDLKMKDNLIQVAVFTGNQLAKFAGLGKSFDLQLIGIESEIWTIFGLSRIQLPKFRVTLKKDFDEFMKAWT